MENPSITTVAPSNPPFLWVEGPKQRDTFGIFSFCFSTIIICIWNTLHFDIPITRQSRTNRFLLRIPWVLVALLAPEALLCAAIYQRIDAGAVAKKALQYLPSRELTKPGRLACAFNHILRRTKSGDVSTNTRLQNIVLTYSTYIAGAL